MRSAALMRALPNMTRNLRNMGQLEYARIAAQTIGDKNGLRTTMHATAVPSTNAAIARRRTVEESFAA